MGPTEFLEQFPTLLEGGRQEDADHLLAILNPLRLPAGQVVVERGDFAASMYLLVKGELRVDLEHAGRRLIIGAVKPGGWVGELAFISPGRASARVTTTADSDMFVLSHDAFIGLRQDHPQAASAILHTLIQTMAQRLRNSSARVLRPVDPQTWTLSAEALPEGASNSGLV